MIWCISVVKPTLQLVSDGNEHRVEKHSLEDEIGSSSIL